MALDSLAAYVNKNNPLETLSLIQVAAIFSKNRKGGTAIEISTWGQAGLTGELAQSLRAQFGRRHLRLLQGARLFKDTVKEQPGSASVVLAVTEDKAGLRYSGIGYKTSGVKTLAHSKLNGEPAYEPNHDNVLAGKYPHGRMLYL